jgi:hypothetical protein
VASREEVDWGETPAEERQRWWANTGQNQLRQLLYWRWDPIGVNDSFPNTFGEYDRYADRMRELMTGDASDTQLERGVIAAALRAQEALGFEAKPGAEEDRDLVTALIIEWRRQSIWMWKEAITG